MPLPDTDLELARNSYYATTAVRGAAFPALAGDAECDVAVGGGGLADLSSAIDLRRRGFDVVLLEAREIGFGASGRNGGQAIHGLACDQTTIEAQLGLDQAKRVWAMSIEALDLLRQRIAEHAIACDWQDGYLGLATSPGKGRELAAWADRTETVYGYPLQRIAQGDIGAWIASRRFHSGVYDARSGHLHPFKYTLALARAAAVAGVRIHEQTPVWALVQGTTPALRTGGGAVRARQVLLAGNDYLHGIAPALQARIMPVGTYIACSQAMDRERCNRLMPSRAAVCDTNFVLDYFRPTPDHRLLYGGRVSYSTLTLAKLIDSMRARLRPPACGHARRGAQRVLPAGPLGPWPGAHRPGRAPVGRGDGGRRVALRRLRPSASPRLSRRPAAAHAGAGAGRGLVPTAGYARLNNTP
jgi:gamma-glutamylputrescine oxidase